MEQFLAVKMAPCKHHVAMNSKCLGFEDSAGITALLEDWFILRACNMMIHAGIYTLLSEDDTSSLHTKSTMHKCLELKKKKKINSRQETTEVLMKSVHSHL